jgi:membrane-associated protein
MIPFDYLPTLPTGPMLYLCLAAIVIASSVPVVALVVAAEPILMAVVILTGANRTSLAILLVVAMIAAVAGDVLTYGLGRWFAPRLLRSKIVARQRRRIIGAHLSLRRRGMLGALVIQRWIVPTRGFVPMLLGVAKEPIVPFLTFSTIAAALWATVFIAGSSLGGTKLVIVIPVIIVGLPLIRLLSRAVGSTPRRALRASGRRPDADAETPAGP